MACRRWLDHVSSHELEIRIPGRSKYHMIVFTFQRSRATGVQIDKCLVRSSHAAACTNRGYLFLSLKVGDQDFGCEHQ